MRCVCVCSVSGEARVTQLLKQLEAVKTEKLRIEHGTYM